METVKNILKVIQENPHLIDLYKNPECKKCNGKGYITRSWAVKGMKSIERNEFCSCVTKGIIKNHRDG